MTQFALAITKDNCASLAPVEKHRDDFLLEVAIKLFPDSPVSEIFIVDLGGKNIDQLILEAQKAVEFLQFEKTDLCHAIKKIALAVDELVFWYGSDCDDLDYVYDVSELLNKLKSAVSESACEVYIHYKQVRPDK
jgi:hypothetical protein